MNDNERGYDEPAAPYAEPGGGPATATQAPPPPPPPSGTAVGTATPEPPAGRRPGVGLAFALIFIGGLLLLVQFVPGLAWWTLWPLIIVAAGVAQAVTPGKEGWSVHRFFDGLVTVAFGLVFLAITLGVIGWSVWWRILGLWPVLLISIGFDILGKSLHSSWLRVVGSLFIIGALAYAVAVSASDVRGIGFVGAGEAREVSVSEPLYDEESATLSLNAGVADLTMASGDELVTLEGTTPFGEPEVSVDRSGSTAEVDVRLGDGDGDGTIMWPGGSDAELEMTLAEDVAWDLELEVGLSALTADLSDLEVRGLALKPGIADCTVTLGDAPDGGEGRVSVKAGISNVRIRVPADAEVRVESRGGLSATNVDEPLESTGSGTWETAGYDDASEAGDPVWLITVESGIGSFDLTTY